MEEYSRILIEHYCMEHNSAKSRRLMKLVRLSYDINAMVTDDDAMFLDKCIQEEKDESLRDALIDLDSFLVC